MNNLMNLILNNTEKKILIISCDYKLDMKLKKISDIKYDYQLVSLIKNILYYDLVIIEEKLLNTCKYDKIIEEIICKCKYKIIHVELNDTEMLNLIKEYLVNNSFDDIKDRTVYRGVFIGKWKFKQRRLYKENKINLCIKLNLEQLGENFKTKLSFSEIVTIIREYMILNRCSYCDIKQNVIFKNIHIGDWKSNQRRKYKEGKLTNVEEEILRLLGEDFNIDSHISFDEMVNLIKEYMSLNNINYNDIVRNTIYKGKNIGQFRLNKRSEYKKGLLSEYEILCLIKLGETFEKIKTK